MPLNGVKQGFAALIIGSCLMLPLAAQAQERFPENTIQVNGTGRVEAQPDSLRLDIGVETQAKTLEAARNQNAELMNTIRSRVNALGIKGLMMQTTGFYVQPVYESPDERRIMEERRRTAPQIVGYMVRNSLMVRVEEADVNQLATYGSRLIDAAVAAGANNVGGIQFYLSDNNTAYQKALTMAVNQAKANAEVIANAAGVRLVGAFTFESYTQPTPVRATMSSMKMEMAEAAVPIPVEPGQMEVIATVNARYEFQD